MNAVQRMTGDDLGNAKQFASFHDWFASSSRCKKLEPGFFFTQHIAVYHPTRKCYCVVVADLADAMALHAIDIPAFQVEKIIFERGNSSVCFNSITDASFYLHIRIFDKIESFLRLEIILKPQFYVNQITTIWRCYVTDVQTRNTVYLNDPKNLNVPVGRDFVWCDEKYKKRIMAKL